MRAQNIGNTAIEAFDHAIGLRCPRLGESVFDPQLVLTVLRYMPDIPAGSLPALLNIDSACAMGGDRPAAYGHK